MKEAVICDGFVWCMCFSLNVNVIRRYLLADLVKSVNHLLGNSSSAGGSFTVAPRRLPTHQQLVKNIPTLCYMFADCQKAAYSSQAEVKG